MKKVFILLYFVFPIFSFGQKQDSTAKFLLPIDSVTKEVTYAEVEHVDSTEANTLYSRAKLFKTVSSTNNAFDIESTDDVSKIVLLNAKAPVDVAKIMKMGFSSTVTYLIKIECKDNRYRYTLSNFLYHIVDMKSGYDIQLKPTDEKPKFYVESDWKFLQMQTKIATLIATDKLKKHMSYNSSF